MGRDRGGGLSGRGIGRGSGGGRRGGRLALSFVTLGAPSVSSSGRQTCGIPAISTPGPSNPRPDQILGGLDGDSPVGETLTWEIVVRKVKD